MGRARRGKLRRIGERPGQQPGRGFQRLQAFRLLIRIGIRLRHQSVQRVPGSGYFRQGGEHLIVPGDDILPAAPVMCQRGVRCSAGQGIERTRQHVGNLLKQGRFSAAPVIDGLLDVSDQGDTSSTRQHFPRQRLHGLPLGDAGILKFINKNVCEARPHAAEALVHAVLPVQHTAGQRRHAGGGQQARRALAFWQLVQRQKGQFQKRSQTPRIAEDGPGRLGKGNIASQGRQTRRAFRPGVERPLFTQIYAGEVLDTGGEDQACPAGPPELSSGRW